MGRHSERLSATILASLVLGKPAFEECDGRGDGVSGTCFKSESWKPGLASTELAISFEDLEFCGISPICLKLGRGGGYG